MRPIIPFLAVMFLCASRLYAPIGYGFDQKQDDSSIRWELQKNSEVKAAQEAFWKYLQNTIWPMKETDIEAAFGKRIGGLPEDASLPVFSYNGVMVSGVMHDDPSKNKNHIEFYRVDDLGYLQIIYQIDGVSVAGSVFYFKTDLDYTPLKNKSDFTKRMAWDKARFEQIKDWISNNQSKQK